MISFIGDYSKHYIGLSTGRVFVILREFIGLYAYRYQIKRLEHCIA
jgi:hypothetical protein